MAQWYKVATPKGNYFYYTSRGPSGASELAARDTGLSVSFNPVAVNEGQVPASLRSKVSGSSTTATTPAPVANTAQTFADDIIKAAQQRIDQDLGFKKPFSTENPFSFDENLARESAKKEFDPYYSEILNDYLGKVGIGSQSLGDRNKLLTELSTTSQGTAGQSARAYERAIAGAEEGYAGSGLFSSGIKKRALGTAEVERGAELGMEATDIQNKQRDIEREKKAAIEGGVLQRRGEAMSQYAAPTTISYLRQFPTSSNPTAGYTGVPDYLKI